MNDLLESLGLYIDKSVDKLNSFKRFNLLTLTNKIDSECKEFIFISKPELHIYDDLNAYKLNPELNGEPVFKDIHTRNPGLLSQLQYSISKNKSPFINLLSYTSKNTVDIPSLTSETIETSANVYGTKIMYRGHSFKNDESVDFSLEFSEDRDLSVYKLFKAWDTYNNLKSIGIVTPTDENYYTIKKISHDKVNIYKFIVASDGMTILFFAKYYGVFPKSAPRESFSEFTGGSLTHSVEFHADFVDDMDPTILADFNAQIEDYRTGRTMHLYDRRNGRINGGMARIPFIQKLNNEYMLRWEE